LTQTELFSKSPSLAVSFKVSTPDTAAAAASNKATNPSVDYPWMLVEPHRAANFEAAGCDDCADEVIAGVGCVS